MIIWKARNENANKSLLAKNGEIVFVSGSEIHVKYKDGILTITNEAGTGMKLHVGLHIYLTRHEKE